MKITEKIKKFADVFAELPGVGPRQATRLAFYFIHKGKPFLERTKAALSDLSEIKICERCFYIHDNGGKLCDICADPERNQKLIAIVEKETDLLSLEKTRRFNGRYLILGDLRKTGVLESSRRERLKSLEEFIKNDLTGRAEEIILALNPNPAADIIADLIREELKPFTSKITRLGRGLPSGGEIEFADDETLGAALVRRN
ncbi:MAG TPA: toprim domain-containing protein [Candidatus Tyrphobacter sp.]|nr:toprim domain-containing protein [Candidatus Tyrphobacter sp.]